MPVNVIVVVNAGSSSIKFSLFRQEQSKLRVFLKGQIEGLYTDAAHFAAREIGGGTIDEKRWSAEVVTHDAAMRYLLDFMRARLAGFTVEAIGHRIVHGGEEFVGPVRLTAEAVERLERLTPLAPLHQPHNLAPVRAVFDIAPNLPQIGCFDTAFHATQPALAQAFALPAEITGRGVRRYGFHGLSYEYIASALPEHDADLARAKVIVAHLGAGASLCALEAGRSVACTTGFTALEGLPMGTRSGALDPGVVLYLFDELKMELRDVMRLLYKQSGLLGVSGVSSDMRVLEASEDPRARFAIDLFVYNIGRQIGSLGAALGGLDAIVFTAGIGEHSAAVRRSVCAGAAWLNVVLEEGANQAGVGKISAPESAVSVWVVPTDEELMIARHVGKVCAEADFGGC
ncbi:acetate/propionate family kinase [Methylocella sp.]|uniref:acetate/propionate family kinase n=1 Tax=Methylocella sp. TaxID=1978226 RepID=UPI003782EF5A